MSKNTNRKSLKMYSMKSKKRIVTHKKENQSGSPKRTLQTMEGSNPIRRRTSIKENDLFKFRFYMISYVYFIIIFFNLYKLLHEITQMFAYFALQAATPMDLDDAVDRLL